jgi:predicted transcriptional regulator
MPRTKTEPKTVLSFNASAETVRLVDEVASDLGTSRAKVLRAAVEACMRLTPDEWKTALEAGMLEGCSDHKPVQHRDGKPPWCPTCGYTSYVPARPAKHHDEIQTKLGAKR